MFKISAIKQTIKYSLRTNGMVVITDSASKDLKPMKFADKGFAMFVCAMYAAKTPTAAWTVSKA
jgi:hypothetical protein